MTIHHHHHQISSTNLLTASSVRTEIMNVKFCSAAHTWYQKTVSKKIKEKKNKKEKTANIKA